MTYKKGDQTSSEENENWEHGGGPNRLPTVTQLSEELRSRERALTMMRRAKAAASAEVSAHLAAGREVYGRRNGKPVVIKPKRVLRPDECNRCSITRELAANARKLGKSWEVVTCFCGKVYPCPPP